MKKAISLILCVLCIFSILTVNIFAETTETVVSETTEYLDNGCYIVTTITEEMNSVVSRATVSKTGSKKAVIYNSDDEPLVTLKLTGTFSYTGSSATCTAASTSYTVHSDNWKVTSAVASKSGNKATGNFTSKRYTLLIPVQTINSTVTITCSNSGVLS